MNASMASATGCQWAMTSRPASALIATRVKSADSAAQPGHAKETSVATRKNQGQNGRRVMRPMPAKIDSPVARLQRSISPITTNWVITPTQNSHQIENPLTAIRLGHSRNSPAPRPIPRAMTEGPTMFLSRGTRGTSSKR